LGEPTATQENIAHSRQFQQTLFGCFLGTPKIR